MRYQHVTFRKLAVGEEFFTKKFRYAKASFFTGRRVLDGALIFVSHWRKVRSTRPFGKQNRLDLIVDDPRSPQKVEGGDRSSETIGGSELTPSA